MLREHPTTTLTILAGVSPTTTRRMAMAILIGTTTMARSGIISATADGGNRVMVTPTPTATTMIRIDGATVMTIGTRTTQTGLHQCLLETVMPVTVTTDGAL